MRKLLFSLVILLSSCYPVYAQEQPSNYTFELHNIELDIQVNEVTLYPDEYIESHGMVRAEAIVTVSYQDMSNHYQAAVMVEPHVELESIKILLANQAINYIQHNISR